MNLMRRPALLVGLSPQGLELQTEEFHSAEPTRSHEAAPAALCGNNSLVSVKQEVTLGHACPEHGLDALSCLLLHLELLL
jgi:hypothetical protein